MNPKNVAFILLALVASACMRAASDDRLIEFVGCIATKAETLFVIKDVDAGAVSGWLGVGQSFRGYTIERYEPSLETLTLLSVKGRIKVKIQDATVRAGEAQRGGVALPERQRSVNLLGALRNPTRIEGSRISTLADAIEAAGGLKEGAKASAVKVTRRQTDGSIVMHSVDASPNASGAGTAASFILRPGDTVFVPSESDGKK